MRYLKETKKIDIDEKFIALLDYEEIKDIKESSIINLREDYTYGVQISIKDETKLIELKNTCKELIDVTKQLVYE